MNTKKFYPLTHPQKGIWYTEKFYPDTGIANIIGIMRLDENLDFAILENAINELIACNDSMRLRIIEQPTGPVQYVSPYCQQEIRRIDFSHYKNSYNRFLSWVDKERRIPVQVNDSDLFEFVIFKLGDGDGGFFLKTHHTISDAWTMILIGNKINEYYFSLLEGVKPTGSNYSSYLDYIKNEEEFCTSIDFEENRRFWNAKFETIPELTTLRPHKQAFSSPEADRLTFTISKELTNKLHQFSEDMSVSIFIICLSALSICLHKILDQDDIIIGTPLLNRPTEKEKLTIGMFIETIPVRLQINPDLKFEEFVQKVAASWREMRNHRYPYNLLLEDIRTKQKLNSNLYDIMLSFQNARFIPWMAFKTFYFASGSEANSLCFHISDRDNTGQLYVDIDYQVALFEKEEVQSLYKSVLSIIEAALKNPARRITDLPLLSKKEKDFFLNKLNNTDTIFADNTLVHSLFEKQVLKTPDNIAIECRQEKLTYHRLNQQANLLARMLRNKGVKPGSIVGVLLDRSCNLAVSLWAILKAGAAYLPLDPDYPAERINYILDDSGSSLVITNQELQEKIGGFPCLMIEDLADYQDDVTDLKIKIPPDDRAYILYTSGSTGNPKGVVIGHKSICNFFTAMAREVDLQNKRVLSVTTVCFDIFVFEFFYPLVNGNTVVMADENQQIDPMELSQLIQEKNIHIIQTTPSRMQLLLMDEAWGSCLTNVTDIILGGEVFPAELFNRIRKITDARVINGYGPTEATVYATFKELKGNEKITIGRPLANVKTYVLDNQLNLLPANIIGNLYIGGEGLARGYLNNEKLTKENFIPSPFEPDKIIYRTGDLVKWNKSGEIDYVGRADHQVKIRGYRIELGEIESALLQHDRIEEAVVIDLESNNEKYLAAYLQVSGQLRTNEIRNFLRKRLPDYMIPGTYIFVSQMPLNANGKIDRRCLAEMESGYALVETEYVKPRNKEEFILADEWSKVLNRDKVGIDDNFFDIGGDSLKIVKILVALLPYKWDLTARDFYKYQTIRKLAEKISGFFISDEEEQLIKDIASVPPASDTSISLPLKLHDILLTGATGFFGAHLLKDLLTSTDANIYCIVRGSSKKNATSRLKKILDFYFPDQLHGLEERVKILPGDITREKWGLSSQQYNQLAQQIDHVFHCAAIVSHYGSYDEFNKTNVQATEQIVDFCLANEKVLHYTSSISVSGKYLVTQTGPNTIFTEQDFYIGQNYYENVYVRSKFEAENLILRAMHSGLKASIYRLGVLSGRYADGQFQINIKENAMYNRIRSIILTGVIPEEFINLKMELTPVDYCSQAVVLLSAQTSSQGRIFHLFNHHPFNLPHLIEAAEICGYKIAVKKGKSYDKHMEEIFQNPVKRELLTGIINDVNISRTVGIDDYPQIVSTVTQKNLTDLGFKWPVPDIPYLIKLLEYTIAIDFIEEYGENAPPKSK